MNRLQTKMSLVQELRGPDVSGLVQKDVPGPSDLSQAPDEGPRRTYIFGHIQVILLEM